MANGNVREVNERSLAYHQSQGTNQVDPIIVKHYAQTVITWKTKENSSAFEFCVFFLYAY